MQKADKLRHIIIIMLLPLILSCGLTTATAVKSDNKPYCYGCRRASLVVAVPKMQRVDIATALPGEGKRMEVATP